MGGALFLCAAAFERGGLPATLVTRRLQENSPSINLAPHQGERQPKAIGLKTDCIGLETNSGRQWAAPRQADVLPRPNSIDPERTGASRECRDKINAWAGKACVARPTRD